MVSININSMMDYQESIMKMFNDESPASQYRRWFNEQGKLFTDVDVELSKSLSHDLKSEIKQCYTNCAKAVLFDYRNQYDYYEGQVYWKGIPIDHAFLVKDNKVVDITFGIDPKIRIKRAKKYGIDLKEKDHEFGTEYFGVKIPRAKLLKLVSGKRTHLPTSFLYWETLK